MKLARLNQVLAVEKSVKTKRENDFTKVYHEIQKVALSEGLIRTYQPRDAEGEKLPTEKKTVILKAEDAIAQAAAALREIFNVTAIKDATNMTAKANVRIDGAVVLKDVPAVHLLFLEKRTTSIIEFINKLPVLSQDALWRKNDSTGLHETEPVVSAKMQKVESFPVVVQATDKHPAQFQKVTIDKIVGDWTLVNFSGAITADRKKKLLERAETVQQAVKIAREEANQAPVVELATSGLVDYIFKD